jgi:hypothetical protein
MNTGAFSPARVGWDGAAVPVRLAVAAGPARAASRSAAPDTVAVSVPT